MFGSLGHSVHPVETGQEAIDAVLAARADGHPFDVAILDLTVPGGIGGREVMAHLATAAPVAKRRWGIRTNLSSRELVV